MFVQQERSYITYPTWKKYMVLSTYIDRLRVREKRQLFHIMRKSPIALDHNLFFPHFGITAGEFATWQVLGDTRKTRRVATKPP